MKFWRAPWMPRPVLLCLCHDLFFLHCCIGDGSCTRQRAALPAVSLPTRRSCRRTSAPTLPRRASRPLAPGPAGSSWCCTAAADDDRYCNVLQAVLAKLVKANDERGETGQVTTATRSTEDDDDWYCRRRHRPSVCPAPN